VSGLHGGAAEADGEVGLAHAGWPEDEDVFGVGDEAASGQLPHELLVDARLELEVELLERFDRRKVGDLDVHRDALALLVGNLVAEHSVEEVEVGGVLLGGVGQHGVEPLGDVAELKTS
jgi:hypothetical protein